MLKRDRNDVFKGTEVNKTNGLRECFIYHYCYLFEMLGFNQKYVMIVMI